jgi:flagellar biosynthesis protein FliR
VLNIGIEQLQQWLGAALWPFLRIGACLMAAPVFGGSYVPRRLRIVFAGALTLVVLPLLPRSGPAALSRSAASCWPTAWAWGSHSISTRCAACRRPRWASSTWCSAR